MLKKGLILLVEDNKKYAKKLGEILSDNDYNVDIVNDPTDGIAEFVKKEYDLVISDLKMASMNGVQFLSTIKKINPDIRTIILTANPSAETEMAALGIEVDRYLLKEIRVDVLLKYVGAIITSKNSPKKKPHVFRSASEELELHTNTREVKKNGKVIELTKKEFDILQYFLENKNIAITREEFLLALWTRPAESVDDRVVDVHIKSLRKKTGCQAIISLRGFGYKWVE